MLEERPEHINVKLMLKSWFKLVQKGGKVNNVL
jgi:hypothetical protein